MSVLPRAIVLGVDTPIGLTVVRELGRHGVPVHAIGRKAGAIGGASRYCEGFSVREAGVPLFGWLTARIRETGAKALLAISEGDLIELAEMPEVIEGCAILTPRKMPLGKVLDKAETLRIARDCGIETPQSWQPLSGDDFTHCTNKLSYPVVLKWADVNAVQPLLDAAGLEMIKAEFIGDSPSLIAALERYRPVNHWPLVQGYAPGHGVGHMIYMEAGRATLRFQHERLHEWPPEGGVSTLCQSLDPLGFPEQMAKSEALLRAMEWEGPAMVEYRYDPATGRFVLMEVNGRFWGSLPLASQSGAEFAWELYRRRVLGQTDDAPMPTSGNRARFMIPETRRLIRVLFQRGKIADPFFRATPLRDLASYLWSLVDPKTRGYVWRWSDSGPFIADMKGMMRRGLRPGGNGDGGGNSHREAMYGFDA
jgi:predicted ATP-grasp superfamily ATP-dependent carboligase